MIKRFNIWMLILFALFLFCCRGPKTIILRDLSFLYASEKKVFLQAKVFRNNEKNFRLYFQFMSLDKNIEHPDSVRAEYYIYDDLESGQVLFSDTLAVNASESGLFFFDIPVPEPHETVLELSLSSESGNRLFFIEMNKQDRNAPENYLLLDLDKRPLIYNYFGEDQEVRVKTAHPEKELLWVYYYHRDFPIAQTPFHFEKRKPFNYRPDSIFSVKLEKGVSELIDLQQQGFYHILSDTSQREGLTLFRFGEDFPEISTPEQMLQPLRYISSSSEFEDLKSSDNTKMAVDKFWLELKGDEIRARNAIKSYYSSAEKANVYFSSYQEGWKTDRGLIYMIYGPPHKMNRGKGYETWLYGRANSLNSIEFTFVQVVNPFTQNDYQLIKSPKYKTSWYYSVDNIRR